MLSSSVVFHFAFLCFVVPNHGLEEAYRGIVPTDIFRDIVNQICSSLKLRTSRNSKIQEYSTIHDFFVSRARLHAHDWKKELNLTSLHIDSGATYFTAILNNVLKEEKEIGQINYMRNKTDVDKFIGNFNSKLAKLKEILFLRNHSRSDLYDEVSQLFTSAGQSRTNDTEEELESVESSAEKIKTWVPGDNRRIFKGAKSTIKQYPFMASIHVLNEFTCAGSIIDEDLIITAASGLQIAYNNRFYRENPKFLTVRVGSSFFNGGGDHIPALEVYFHPSYDPKTLHNNLAIIRLHRNIKFQKKVKRVKRINIDPHPWPLPLNTAGITIVGWGARTINNKVFPGKSKLAMDVLDVYPLKDCQDIYSKAYVTNRHFCAGFVSRGGGACNRDVGAPGVIRGVLVGVTSFGSATCGAPDSPTVFTKLGFYTNWIEEILELENPTHRMSVKPRSTKRYSWDTILSTYVDNRLITPNEYFGPINDAEIVDSIHTGRLGMYQATPASERDRTPPVSNDRGLADYQTKNKDTYIDVNVNNLKVKEKRNKKIRMKEPIVRVNSEEFPDLTGARYDTGLSVNDTYARARFDASPSYMENYNEEEKSSSESNIDPVPKYTGSNIQSGALVEEPLPKMSSERSLEEQIDQLFEKMSKAGKNKKDKKETNDKKKRNRDNEENSDESNNSSYLNEALSKEETSEVSSDAS